MTALRRTLLLALASCVLLATSEASTVIDDMTMANSGDTVTVRFNGLIAATTYSEISVRDPSNAASTVVLRSVDAPDLEGDTIVRWHPLCRRRSPCTLTFTIEGPQTQGGYEVSVMAEDSPASGEYFGDDIELTVR